MTKHATASANIQSIQYNHKLFKEKTLVADERIARRD